MHFVSAVAGNIAVKTKRKSNLENDNFLLCFATNAFYSIFETPQTRLDVDRHKKRVLFIKNLADSHQTPAQQVHGGARTINSVPEVKWEPRHQRLNGYLCP